MLTKERLELELLRVVEKVPKDYFHQGSWYKDGAACLVGSVCINLGAKPEGREYGDEYLSDFWDALPMDEDARILAESVMAENDNRRPWHSIVYRLIHEANTAASPETPDGDAPQESPQPQECSQNPAPELEPVLT